MLGQFKDFLDWATVLGIHNDVVILGLIGVGVLYFMYKQQKNQTEYSERNKKFLDKLEDVLVYLKDQHENIHNYHAGCTKDNATILAQRETMSEKVDNLEDHLKEIKKQLLFK